MAAETVLLPFLMSMLLGRTIDLTSYEVGTNIYDNVDYVQSPVHKLNATYHVVKGDSFDYEQFGMPVDIALRIKANYLSSRSGALGLDGLLKDTAWMQNSAMVAVTVFYSTVQRTLTSHAPLISGWKDRIGQNHTHYAASAIYGGWFIVLYRFECAVHSDLPLVYKTVQQVLGNSGTIGENTPQLWGKVKNSIEANKEIRGEVSVLRSVYTSVRLPVEIDTPVHLIEAIKKLPRAIGMLGSPIFMVLKPLSTIDSSFPTVQKSDALVKDLSKLVRMWDDVQHTRSVLLRWLQETLASFEDEEEERISKLLETLTECLRLFRLVIEDVSLYKKGDDEALQRAFEAYKKGLTPRAANYNLAFLRLKEDVDSTCETNFLNGIKGLLNVYEKEGRFVGEVGGNGIEDCKKECLKEDRCKAIGYSDSVSELDLSTGSYVKKKNQCWVYYRSTSTAAVITKTNLYGDIKVYDRYCL